MDFEFARDTAFLISRNDLCEILKIGTGADDPAEREHLTGGGNEPHESTDFARVVCSQH